MTTEQINTPPTPEREKFIEFNGLWLYTGFLASAIGALLYLQLNGISILKDSNTEHEGNQHSYGHHK